MQYFGHDSYLTLLSALWLILSEKVNIEIKSNKTQDARVLQHPRAKILFRNTKRESIRAHIEFHRASP